MKKGFTLVELLAAIVILIIILAIAIPGISQIIDSTKYSAFSDDEKLFVRATKNYLSFGNINEPQNIGDTVEVTLTQLKSAGLMDNIKSPWDKDTNCNGYVLITKTDSNKYDYEPYLNCVNNIGSKTDDGLVTHWAFDDYEEPTKNIIPNGSVNAYPTIGNTYGTYNTNQYNNNAFFSIGTISSVENNIVTLATVNHAIYTYDVLTPQTSGGGVTAGTSYFIKKLSSNSFALYPYKSTQDGSLGFAVYNSIYNDQKVSINSTNFPTMWFGMPHMPNSALVKEIIKDGFNKDGVIHDCIRLHTEHKPEGDADGMAYGVTPSVVSGTKYTYSFYYRASNAASIGKTINIQLYTNGSYWTIPSSVITVNSTEWMRYTGTMTAPNTGGTNLYFTVSKGSTFDISGIQFEAKNYVTPFTATERTGTVKDYSGNGNDAPLQLTTTPKWVNDSMVGEGAYEFNGTNSIITVPHNAILNGNNNVITISAWIKPTTLIADTHQRLINKNDTSGYILNIYGSRIEAYVGGQLISGPTINAGEWGKATVTVDGTKLKFYYNGELYREATYTGIINGSTASLNIGASGSIYFNGILDDIRIYNRTLTASEIKNMYDIEKNR